MTRRLYRSRTDTILGGVAGGVADYLDVDPSLVRIVWAILAIITGGIFVVLYIVMWIVVPQTLAAEPAGASGDAGSDSPAPGEGGAPASPPRPVVHRQRSGNGTLIFGLILIGVGAWFLVRQYVDINLDRLWPIGLVLLGVLLLLVSLRRSPEH